MERDKETVTERNMDFERWREHRLEEVGVWEKERGGDKEIGEEVVERG